VHGRHALEWDEFGDKGLREEGDGIARHGQGQERHLQKNSVHGPKLDRRGEALPPEQICALGHLCFLNLEFRMGKVLPDGHRGEEMHHEEEDDLALRVEPRQDLVESVAIRVRLKRRHRCPEI